MKSMTVHLRRPILRYLGAISQSSSAGQFRPNVQSGTVPIQNFPEPKFIRKSGSNIRFSYGCKILFQAGPTKSMSRPNTGSNKNWLKSFDVINTEFIS